MEFQRFRVFSLVAAAILAAATLAPVHPAVAGAFMAPEGEGEVITALRFSGSTRAFDQSGRLIPVPSYQKFELGSYIEYGVRDWLTAVAMPSVDHIHNGAPQGPGQSAMGIGDTAVGARLLIHRTSLLVFSMQGLLRPPSALQIDPATRSFTHSRSLTGELRGLAGASGEIMGYGVFADLGIGYRWNDMTTPGEWRADATLGFHATPAIMILLQDFAAVSNGRTAKEPSYLWDKAEVSAVYAFSPAWSAQLGGFLTLAGRNAGREHGPMAALWYRF